ncbi:MAG TPA: hypothetical protein VJX68_17800, partial [Candidatus Binatus sp.]|uniref:hypothetical protein n=1 Tax=Candidatus Binatus sp. TaxID=2811406 RepID=UPI002B49BE55
MEIVAEARRTVWPHLNEEFLRLISPNEFTRFWSGLGVQFRLARLTGPEGLALLGFYVREMGRSRLPLICVNTAHHPAAVGAAFSHEMGHHLIGMLFDSPKERAQFLTYTAYGEHLDDPEELAADILVSLGVFPEATAREIFMEPVKGRPSRSGAQDLTDTFPAIPDSPAGRQLAWYLERVSSGAEGSSETELAARCALNIVVRAPFPYSHEVATGGWKRCNQSYGEFRVASVEQLSDFHVAAILE